MAKIITPHGFTLLVDQEDLKLLREYYLEDRFYVKCARQVNGKRIARPLHHVVLKRKIPQGCVVDHINGNPLDCRKSNLRVCTHKQNSYNRKPKTGKKYKGIIAVQHSKNCKIRWRVDIHKTGDRKGWYKTFATEYQAVRAYNKKVREIYGEYAWINVWTGPTPNPKVLFQPYKKPRSHLKCKSPSYSKTRRQKKRPAGKLAERQRKRA